MIFKIAWQLLISRTKSSAAHTKRNRNKQKEANSIQNLLDGTLITLRMTEALTECLPPMALIGTSLVRFPSGEFVVRVARLDHSPWKQDLEVPEQLAPVFDSGPIGAPVQGCEVL